MKKNIFIKKIIELGFDKNYVKFNDTTSDDVICVNQNYNIWEVFYRERGIERDLVQFPDIETALDYVYKDLEGLSKYIK